MSCITEILKLKGDQEALVPEGNWIAVEGGGTYKGYEYLVVFNTNGYRCGYVALPPEHPYSDTPEEQRTVFSNKPYSHWDYDKLDINCHGGLTFMSPHHELKFLLTNFYTDMWIGFDCGHCDDLCDIEAYKKYFGEEATEQNRSFFAQMNHGYGGQTIKQFDYVVDECHSIIDQLIKVATCVPSQ